MRLTTPITGLRKLRHRPGLPLVAAVSLGLNLGQWAYLIWRVQPQADPIPLHYTIAFGIDRIGSWLSAYMLPATGTAVFLANAFTATFLAEHQPATASYLFILTLFLETVLLAGALLIFRPL